MLVDWFWFSLVLSILLLWLLWHWPQLWPHFQTTTVAAARQRLLKPRTPDDCPECRQTRAAAADYPSTHIPVIPWRERKSRRGAPKRILTQGFPVPSAPVPTTVSPMHNSMPWWVTAPMVVASGYRPCAARRVAPPSALAAIRRSMVSKQHPTELLRC